MKKLLLSLLLLIGVAISNYGQDKDTATVVDYAAIDKSLHYQTGKIKLTSGNATLTVPKGFKFLDAKQTQYVLKDLWGNPEDLAVLGALVPVNKGVISDDSWLFTINYEDMGYVEDDDAKDTDYDELLENIKKEMADANPERIKAGYPGIELMGWASKPYYDENKKVLHWAKEIKFGTDSTNTLNYDLRILGRKGVFVLSAVASMKEFPEVKANMNNVISSISFNDGDAYADFDSSTDSVAAWTIGGLVAGKVLAKVGFFAILLKFGKFILIGLAALWGGLKKFVFGKKDQVVTKPKEEEEPAEISEKEKEEEELV